MKKKSILRKTVCLCCLIVGCLASVPTQASSLKQSDGKDIRIVQRPTIPSGAPRTPAYCPFYAELMEEGVLLGSFYFCGVVDVTLTSTAGDDYSTVFDTADGTIVIPISGSTGEYTLLITTASGLEFIGEFVL